MPKATSALAGDCRWQWSAKTQWCQQISEQEDRWRCRTRVPQRQRFRSGSGSDPLGLPKPVSSGESWGNNAHDTFPGRALPGHPGLVAPARRTSTRCFLQADQNFPFRGAAILIKVGFGLETVKQISAQMELGSYPALMR